MAYNIELEINTNALDMVEKFANGHGCTHKIIKAKGPKQLIQFSSGNFNYLEELIQQILGFIPTEKKIKTMVWES